MTGLTELLIGDAEKILRREAEKLRSGTSLDRLLAGWLLPSTYSSQANAVAQSIVSQWRAAKQGGAPRSYQLVGALALATSLDSEDLERRDAFNDGLDWACRHAGEPLAAAHAQAVEGQGCLRALPPRSWRGFREKRGRIRVEPAPFRRPRQWDAAHAETS